MPVGDAAKLYWHFYHVDQSGVSGVTITLFLYAVLSLLSVTVLFIYILRSGTLTTSSIINIVEFTLQLHDFRSISQYHR